MSEEDEFAFADTTIADRLPDPLFLTPDHGVLHFEHRQLEDAGRDLSTVSEQFAEAFALDPDDPDLADRVTGLLDVGSDLPMREDDPSDEPSDLDAIRDRRPDGPRSFDRERTREEAFDVIYGGWLGACAGCLLGKPVQGWGRDRIVGYLRDSGQYPLTGYIRSDSSDELIAEYNIHQNLEEMDSFVNEVRGMPIDDDIDYIAVGLGVLQTHGVDFSTTDVGNYWLEHLPLFNTYTAERVAYRNLANRVMPPASATTRNPYREMVGALIRADPWGYVALDDPEYAAELAHRDARLSHVKNGIYGEMWAAAMIAAAPAVDDIETLLDVGLSEVPANCRLATEVAVVREWYDDGVDVREAADRIHERWDETDMYHWVHTLSNAQIIAMALLWSEGDFEEAICRAVETGFDTDSHAATIGSILGTFHGAGALPDSWVDPLEDTVRTSLPEHGRESISDFAEQTVERYEQVRRERDGKTA